MDLTKLFQQTHVKALIFDMDGVLIDSEPVHLCAFQKFFQEYGIEYTEADNGEFLGQKDIEIADQLIARYELPLTREQVVAKKEEAFQSLIIANPVARDGLIETLEAAARLQLKLAVASSATLGSIKLIVNVLDIRKYFHSLTSGDEVQNGKPAPDVYLLAAERLGVPPQNCLVIEDTDAGVQAAKSANMRCIAIPCDATRHQEHRLADLKLESLLQLRLEAHWRSAPDEVESQ
jgi:haloacid dehalogenase superfamily, subfamily IA, variant 3 with third motif having DD or ED/haloacid dehalogenase superfamily, subfamily IA, variant 1 with third motif having Dx(3-4)D or Dx(3-4)E/beta-phosphoglucomutase family hydrolase